MESHPNAQVAVPDNLKMPMSPTPAGGASFKQKRFLDDNSLGDSVPVRTNLQAPPEDVRSNIFPNHEIHGVVGNLISLKNGNDHPTEKFYGTVYPRAAEDMIGTGGVWKSRQRDGVDLYGSLPRGPVMPRPARDNYRTLGRPERLPRDGGRKDNLEIYWREPTGESKYDTLPLGKKKKGVDVPLPRRYGTLDRRSPPHGDRPSNNEFYGKTVSKPPSWGSGEDGKITVREATMKRNALSRTGSQLRTRLDLYDKDL